MAQVLSRTGTSGAMRLAARLPKLRRFLRSPKGYLLIALALLAALAIPGAGTAAALTTLAAAVAGAAGMELLLVRLGQGEWRFPGSALLSGLIVGLVLSAQEPWWVAAIAGLLATDAKHLLRLGRSHIFNPAALGLLAVYALFATGQSWWGALPGLPVVAVIVLLAAGYLVADRANKVPAALAFLGVYFAMFTLGSFTGSTAAVSSVFITPFIHAALFFAFFMVTDPPTSPVRYGEQLWFGALVAVISYVIYMTVSSLVFLPLGLLAGNAAYALYRYANSRVRAASRTGVRAA